MNINEILKENDIYKYVMNIKDERLRREIFSECRILNYKAQDITFDSTEDSSHAYIILSGRVNLRIFVTESIDYIIPWENQHWYGALSILNDDFTESEVIFLEDTSVFSFPLKKIIYAEQKENYELWVRIAKMAGNRLRSIHIESIKRAALTTEAYFLNSFRDNGYRFENLSIPDISYKLKINTRTLQRLIQSLEKKDLIHRNKVKKIIFAKDRDRIDEYIDSIT